MKIYFLFSGKIKFKNPSTISIRKVYIQRNIANNGVKAGVFTQKGFKVDFQCG
jgi:hypothetical protein